MKRHLFAILPIISLSLVLYANTLRNGFVYDDEATIVNNYLIRDFENLSLLLNKTAYFSRSGEVSYRPLVTITYFIDYAIHGLKPRGYHLTNILLHTINGVLLYFLIILFLRVKVAVWKTAFLVSILFVVHPVLTEAVNGISYREDLLTFFFYISALNLYLIVRQHSTKPRSLASRLLYLFSCLFYLLGLLSKEMAITLPLIILCYEWCFAGAKSNLASRLFPRYIIGYVVITIFYLYIRFYLFYNPEKQAPAWGLLEGFLTAPWLVMSYLKQSILPIKLSADYVIKPVPSILSPSFILPFIFLVLVVSFALRDRKRFLFGILFFLITLLPVYNIVPIFNPFAERYIYLPIVGFLVITVEVINTAEQWNKKLFFISSLLIVICIFGIAVIKRNAVWRDGYSLWTDTLRKMPNSSHAHNGMGVVYDKLGRINDAVLEFRAALSLKQGNPETHSNLGNAYSKLGRMDDAILEYREALRLKPDYTDAHYNLGNVYDKLGRLNDAVLEYREALRLKPDDPEIYYNFGNVYNKLGRMEDAVLKYKEALGIKPDYIEVYGNLGVVYYKLGLVDDAISEYRKALRLKPDYSDILFNLGMAYKKKGLNAEAKQAFEEALMLNPDDNEAKEMLTSLR